jgi:SAM-dependent methyltransferase
MMPLRRRVCFFAAALALAGFARAAPGAERSPGASPQPGARAPDVIFLPTPQRVVNAMLRLARVGRDDVVYDLGCGDGRIVVSAARLGARGVGIDIDPERIREANARIRTAGVGERARVLQADLFEADISEASVVTLYLLSSLNEKLKPKLLRELRPRTRVVSHGFDMGHWKPEKSVNVGGSTIHLWRIPPRQE